jgi:hypothetical protein
MRKKMLLLTLALAATAALAAPRAQAAGSLIGGGPYHSCPMCTTYEDGSQCCVPCQCGASGVPVLCADVYCAPAGGLD